MTNRSWTKSWMGSVGAAFVVSSLLGSAVVGCSKKKQEDTKAQAEKAEADKKKKPHGDRYADGKRLASTLKDWTTRWAETADLPACDPLLKDAAELELCKTAGNALTALKAAVAKPEPEATLIHSAAELAFATTTADNMPEGMEPGLEETTFYDPANFTFPASAHVAKVEINPKTGEVELQGYAAVDDVGNVINPMIVEGQILGGIVQGVGQALWEHGIYDEDGQLLSGSMMSYALPRADAFPSIAVDRVETPSPHNPLGVKGAGEMGTIAATAAVSSAVLDALAPLGITHLNMPLTPEKIHQAISTAGNGGGE